MRQAEDHWHAEDFAAALLRPENAPPAGILAPASRRFAVYRNNVAASLTTALAEIFPTVARLVGPEFFAGMARLHIAQSPPRQPMLFEYGRDFADFIAAFPPAADLPFLADVARLERLWLDAFHAEDRRPLTGRSLAAIPPAELPELRLAIHPATGLLRSDYAAVSIVARDRNGETLAGLDWSIGEDALVTRPAFDVMITRLPPGGHAFVATLLAGATLGEAADAALKAARDADLPTLIGMGLSTGLFSDAAANRETTDDRH